MERRKIGYILKVLKVLSDDVKDGFSEWTGWILWARSITHKQFFVLGMSKKSTLVTTTINLSNELSIDLMADIRSFSLIDYR